MSRRLLATCCAFFLASLLIGCGSSVPGPPDGAKDGPPPGGAIPIKGKK